MRYSFAGRTSIRKLTISVAVAVALFVLLYTVVFGSHLFNANSYEIAGRLACVSNLKRIRGLLAEQDRPLSPNESWLIQDILDDLKLCCPSGKRMHKPEGESLYCILETSDGGFVITENPDNHDTEQMRFTDLPYVRYCVYWANGNGGQLRMGRWTGKTFTFGEIRPLESDIASTRLPRTTERRKVVEKRE